MVQEPGGHKQSQDESQLCNPPSIGDICARVEALESSSKRIESKLDQILSYCRLLTGGVNLE